MMRSCVPTESAPTPVPSGCFVVIGGNRQYLPLINVDVHAAILSYASRTTLTQTFVQECSNSLIGQVRYNFPLYDGVSIISFNCAIGANRLMKGIVKERQSATNSFQQSISQGKTAALFEQCSTAADVFTTTIGNVPTGKTIRVEIVYLSQLHHDAEIDGLRFTVPTYIAPRYGKAQDIMTGSRNHQRDGELLIVADFEMAQGCPITNVQSPSHPISVTLGNTSTLSKSSASSPSPQRASATLSLGSTQLDRDFVIQLVALGLGNPVAIVETYPDAPYKQAVMATLVPRFNLPSETPEVVFVCDRSGSMGESRKMPDLIAALQIFLKSLPLGSRFNICSFGSQHSFLWEKSQLYNQLSLEAAVDHVKSFSADLGGTEIFQPLEDAFKRRCIETNLEVFLITDGEVWCQDQLFDLVDYHVVKSKGRIRVFTLGVGKDVSHALIQGVARAGNGFSQTVGEGEKMGKKIIRMLKGALFPHITDYTLNLLYEEPESGETENLFQEAVHEKSQNTAVELELKHRESPKADSSTKASKSTSKEIISLFDPELEILDMEGSLVTIGSTAEEQIDGLPSLPPQRYLQSPCKISSLFPFRRTTVFVLISSNSERVLKSVILRGASTYGPLEIEINATQLSKRGTTIHQLAARAAIQELEEGRGCIFHAKSEQGRLLKEDFSALLPALIRREAVRLGVEYQVTNKWCSFVAVHQTVNKQESQDIDDDDLSQDFEIIRPGYFAPSIQRMLASPSSAPMCAAAAMPSISLASAPISPVASAAEPILPRRLMRKATKNVYQQEPTFVNSDVAEGSGWDEDDVVASLADLQTFIGSWS